MVICLVTDRRRLGAAIGAGSAGLVDALEAQVAAAIEADIDLVQIREPDLEARSLASLVRSLARRVRGRHTRIVVNDRLDVALAAGAGGVHLKENSFAPEPARSLGESGFIITCAVHTPFTAAARHSANFLIAGTVLPTVSKSRADYLGWKGLAEVIAASKGTPVLGIGGLDLTSIPTLAASGAAGVAAVGAFIPPVGETRVQEFVKKRVIDMRFAFDSAQSEP
jgi:thiamine-phosphate pyrophosphorylase